jgi:putative transcriptional regulator
MTSLSLKARFERLGPVAGVNRNPSGSSVGLELQLLSPQSFMRPVDAALLLATNGLSLLSAKRALESLLKSGLVRIELSSVPDADGLVAELQMLGIGAIVLSEKSVDVRQLRTKLNLTQKQFALNFGIELDTLQNWEQGKRAPDKTAMSYLRVIDRAPDVARKAQLS